MSRLRLPSPAVNNTICMRPPKAEGSKRPGDPAVIDVELEDEDLLDLQDNALNQCQGRLR